MNCIRLYITKSVHGFITDRDNEKCKYLEIKMIQPDGEKNPKIHESLILYFSERQLC